MAIITAIKMALILIDMLLNPGTGGISELNLQRIYMKQIKLLLSTIILLRVTKYHFYQL